jgi:hypothetical protein
LGSDFDDYETNMAIAVAHKISVVDVSEIEAKARHLRATMPLFNILEAL